MIAGWKHNARSDIRLFYCQDREEYLPGEQRFRRKTKDDIYLFTEQIIPPGTHFLILQYHVDREAVKEDEQ
jgi:hypothetical protein